MCDAIKTSKLTFEQWTQIETPLPLINKQVLLTLQSLINPKHLNNIFVKPLDETTYLAIRHLLTFLDDYKPINLKKSIRYFSTEIELVEKQLQNIFCIKNLNNFKLIESYYVEMHIIYLMHLTTIIINELSLNELYELFCGLNYAYKMCHVIPNFSVSLLNDLQYVIFSFKKKYNITYRELYTNHKQFLTETKYHFLFPQYVMPYESQKLFADCVKNDQPLIIYKSDTGKTSSIIMVIEHMFDKNFRNNTTTQVIYASSIEKSRVKVCQIAYDRVLPFSVATFSDEIKVICHRSGTIDTSVLIVADLESAHHLLTQPDANYILFYDDAIIDDKKFKKIINNRPSSSIICVPKNYSYEKDEKIVIGENDYTQTKLSNIKNLDIIAMIEKLSKSNFKQYDILSLYELFDVMKKYNVTDIDLEEELDGILTQERDKIVTKVVIKLLTTYQSFIDKNVNKFPTGVEFQDETQNTILVSKYISFANNILFDSTELNEISLNSYITPSTSKNLINSSNITTKKQIVRLSDITTQFNTNQKPITHISPNNSNLYIPPHKKK